MESCHVAPTDALVHTTQLVRLFVHGRDWQCAGHHGKVLLENNVLTPCQERDVVVDTLATLGFHVGFVVSHALVGISLIIVLTHAT